MATSTYNYAYQVEGLMNHKLVKDLGLSSQFTVLDHQGAIEN